MSQQVAMAGLQPLAERWTRPSPMCRLLQSPSLQAPSTWRSSWSRRSLRPLSLHAISTWQRSWSGQRQDVALGAAGSGAWCVAGAAHRAVAARGQARRAEEPGLGRRARPAGWGLAAAAPVAASRAFGVKTPRRKA
jgi:hypothetical protein